MSKKPTELELSICRTIDRHYKKNPNVRMSHIRAALKSVDRTLLEMLSKVRKKWRKA